MHDGFARARTQGLPARQHVAATDTMIAELAGTQRRHGSQLEEVSATQTEHSGSLAEHGVKLDAILEILRAR